MSLGGSALVIVVAVIVIAGGLAQIRAYRREGSVLSAAQLALRLIMALLLLAVLALSAYGLPRLVTLGPGLSPEQRLAVARQLAAFWTVVVVLVVVVVALALTDLRHLRANQRRARAAMYRNLAKLQEEIRARQPAEKPAEEAAKE